MQTTASTQSFGKLRDGSEAKLYVLTNKNGAVAKVTNYGATLTELHIPDKDGKMANVVLGFDNLDEYLTTKCYFGGTVGRYANRIARGRFELDGDAFELPMNTPPCTLHGGAKGFDKVLWAAEQSEKPGSQTVRFTHHSQDKDQGFPGNLNVAVTYTLNDNNTLEIGFEAETDKPTVVNLTNHSYFNLNGLGNGTILEHELKIAADRIVEVNSELLPTGKTPAVKGTPFDFTNTTKIGKNIKAAGGYDHTYCLDAGETNEQIVLTAAGRRLKISTTQPGVQIFTCDSFDGIADGVPYYNHSGIAIETQHFPDSPNHPHFPSTTLLPGQKYSHKAVYDFSLDG